MEGQVSMFTKLCCYQLAISCLIIVDHFLQDCNLMLPLKVEIGVAYTVTFVVLFILLKVRGSYSAYVDNYCDPVSTLTLSDKQKLNGFQYTDQTCL